MYMCNMPDTNSQKIIIFVTDFFKKFILKKKTIHSQGSTNIKQIITGKSWQIFILE